MKKIYLIIFSIALLSCKSKKVVIIPENINSKYNQEYIDSKVSIFGKLTTDNYSELISKIESSLNIKIDKSRKIYLNFQQKGKNCIRAGQNSSKIDFSKTLEISERITSKYNTQRILSYHKNSFFYNQLSSKKIWVLDSKDFLNNTVFDLKENCEAFLIIKPNGEFYKFYGEDHFSTVENLLKNENWDSLKNK